MCLLHVLQFAFPALDEVDDVPRLAGCFCTYVVEVASGSAHESILGLDVLAGSASRVTAWTLSLNLAIVRCLQLCTYQEVPKVLGPVISYNRGFGYGLL